MLLHKNNILEIYHEPENNLLRLNMLDYSDSNVHEANLSLQIIKEYAVWNFSKKLLIDSSRAKYGNNREGFSDQARRFIETLTKTPVRKVARIKSHSKRREAIISKVFYQFSKNDLDIKFREFTNEVEALNWLVTDSGSNHTVPD